MAIVKSELIKELKKSYPNFLTRDLNKVIEIILKEIKETLNRNERVEFRNFGTFQVNIQKAYSFENDPVSTQIAYNVHTLLDFKVEEYGCIKNFSIKFSR